jgi:hypothetical protein
VAAGWGHRSRAPGRHRVFNALRDNLGWVNRGGHAAIRLHDLRHTFVVVA